MLPDGGSIPPTSTKPENDGPKWGRFLSMSIVHSRIALSTPVRYTKVAITEREVRALLRELRGLLD